MWNVIDLVDVMITIVSVVGASFSRYSPIIWWWICDAGPPLYCFSDSCLHLYAFLSPSHGLESAAWLFMRYVVTRHFLERWTSGWLSWKRRSFPSKFPEVCWLQGVFEGKRMKQPKYGSADSHRKRRGNGFTRRFMRTMSGSRSSVLA